uniref:DZF domain-containing protein n=1 Tax=Micrurus carvalhoi TaxID=3147026 RepID=A0A2H6NAV0_9SAUR
MDNKALIRKICICIIDFDNCSIFIVLEISFQPLELLCEKSIGTANRPMGAGEALRRVLECLASGIVMPDGSGIYDPCEKEATDAIGHLDRQQREDITQSAQHALRLAAFGQLHKVLGMDPLPSKMPKKPKNENPVDYTGMF